MPMIDLYCPSTLFPEALDRELGEALTLAVLRAEGVSRPTTFHKNNTAFFMHRLPASCVQTAASPSAEVVRVQIITPPGVLSREGQKMLVRETAQIVCRIAGDDSLAGRTWTILSEAAEGGWGIGETAFGREEFQALVAGASRAKGS